MVSQIREDQRRQRSHDQGSADGKWKGVPQRVARRPQGDERRRKVIPREQEQILDRKMRARPAKAARNRRCARRSRRPSRIPARNASASKERRRTCSAP